MTGSTTGSTIASNRELAFAAIAPLALLVVQIEAGAELGLVLLAAFIAPPLVIARRHGGVRTGLGLGAPAPLAALGATLIGASLWLAVVAVLGPVIEAMPDHAETEASLEVLTDPALPLGARLLLFAALPALVEELLCRGLLCRHLAAGLGRGAGLGISALYFAALHLSLSQGLPALVVGLVAGALVLATGSTWTAVAYHAANNAALIVASAPELVVGDLIAEAPFATIVGALGCTALGGLVVLGSRRSPK